jgi:hypothetical protein
MNTCPYCGQVIRARHYEAAAPAVDLDYLYPDLAAWSQPARIPTPQSDVIVPFSQAVITGGIMFFLAIVVTITQRWPWYVPLIAGLLTLAAVWLILLWDHRRSLWAAARPAPSLEPDPAQAPAQPETLNVTVTHNPQPSPDDRLQVGGSMTFCELPTGKAQLARIGAEVADGRRKWSGEALAGCAGLSVRGADKLVKAMLKGGLLRYREGKPNHPDGAELTPAGRALIRKAGTPGTLSTDSTLTGGVNGVGQ